MIWIPVVLWLVTLAAFVGVAVLFINQIGTVPAVVVEGSESVPHVGPNLQSPLSWILMIIFGFLFLGFVMRMLIRPFLFFGLWGCRSHMRFGNHHRSPWWGETKEETHSQAEDETS
jgi:hypothetical protein